MKPYVKSVNLHRGHRLTLDYLQVELALDPARSVKVTFYPSFGDREEGICPELPGQGPFTEAEWLAFDVATAALEVLLRRARRISVEDLERVVAEGAAP